MKNEDRGSAESLSRKESYITPSKKDKKKKVEKKTSSGTTCAYWLLSTATPTAPVHCVCSIIFLLHCVGRLLSFALSSFIVFAMPGFLPDQNIFAEYIRDRFRFSVHLLKPRALKEAYRFRIRVVGELELRCNDFILSQRDSRRRKLR